MAPRLLRRRRARLARALEAQRAGLEASAAWNSDVDDVARSIPRQREAAERDAERIRDQLIGLQQQARSAHESTFRVPNALIQQLQRLNTRLQDAVNAARRLSRINSDDFGRDGRWAAVMGRCAESAPLSEKEVKCVVPRPAGHLSPGVASSPPLTDSLLSLLPSTEAAPPISFPSTTCSQCAPLARCGSGRRGRGSGGCATRRRNSGPG